MTWLFVRMLPSASMMKPLPAPRRGRVAIVVARRREVRQAVEQIRRTRRPPRRLRPSRAARRRIDVDDRRVDPLDDVGEVDERRHRRPAAVRAGADDPADTCRAWLERALSPAPPAATADRATPPATIAPTRNATTAVRATVTSVKRRDISAFHYKRQKVQKLLLIQRFDAELLAPSRACCRRRRPTTR